MAMLLVPIFTLALIYFSFKYYEFMEEIDIVERQFDKEIEDFETNKIWFNGGQHG